MVKNRWEVYQRFFFYINYFYTQNLASTFLIPCRHARGRVYKRIYAYAYDELRYAGLAFIYSLLF